ncbi:MAG: hypothetical protein JO222_07765, partial [Frankiales bacterium]|nr:hypothetical protein [Frankiales bacterium]
MSAPALAFSAAADQSVPTATAAAKPALAKSWQLPRLRNDVRHSARHRAAHRAPHRHVNRRASRSQARVALTGSPQTIAHAMLLREGWGEGEWSCLDTLWMRESNWETYASNGGSGAYGIPQALPGSKMASAGAD